jgi:betaine lipid synthase
MSSHLFVHIAENPAVHVGLAVAALSFFIVSVFLLNFLDFGKPFSKLVDAADAYVRFCWACFLKPHSTKSRSQQDALESFYRAQANVYDKTRGMLLQGREDMLGLVAAQLKSKAASSGRKPIWIDVGAPAFFSL